MTTKTDKKVLDEKVAILWKTFSTLETMGEERMRKVYDMMKTTFGTSKIMLTALATVTNWKLWKHYNNGNQKLARIYDSLWKDADTYACETLKGEDKDFYFQMTD